jgi:hypothetical protein
MGVKLAAASGGSIELVPTNTASAFTVTVPAVTGTMLTNATTTGFPAGSVLQVVQATYAVQTTISTSTYTDTGLSASITPTSASSKILVFISQSIQTQIAANTDAITAFRIVRDSTAIHTMTRVNGIRAGTGDGTFVINVGYVTPIYLDSPSTTSSVTYKSQFSMTSGANSIANSASTISTITLMEIAA